MKTFRKLLVFAGILGILVLVAAPVRADWDPSMPTKYVQLPDLETTGMDVNATFWKDTTGATVTLHPPFVKILADDFPCRTTGPITSIHIWGSWLFDKRNAKTKFKLSIHDDVPVSADNLFSHPGNVLWKEFFGPGDYVDKLVATADEQFYEPNTDQIIGTDTQVWQYNFFPEVPFVQEGTAAEPKTYWLDVQAIVPFVDGVEPEVFGWKTSLDHWNDDATFADTALPGGPPITPWKELRYPIGYGHPYEGKSIDLAFAIVPESGTMLMILAGATTTLVAGAWRRRGGRRRHTR